MEVEEVGLSELEVVGNGYCGIRFFIMLILLVILSSLLPSLAQNFIEGQINPFFLVLIS